MAGMGAGTPLIASIILTAQGILTQAIQSMWFHRDRVLMPERGVDYGHKENSPTKAERRSFVALLFAAGYGRR